MKQKKHKTAFSLNNIHTHQINHLINVYSKGGISFLIVRFTVINETYFLETSKLAEYIEDTNRKSIPVEFFRDNGYLIKDGYRPRIDYLKIVDKLIGGI